jgi:hypothetical protein
VYKWVLLLAAALLAACQAVSSAATFDSPWRPTDLRILEAPGTQDPAHDLVAAYARLTRTDLELRFDLLGSPEPFDYDLYVVFDTGRQGGGHLPFGAFPNVDWDIAFSFPAQGLPRAFSAAGNVLSIRPRINRDSVQDSAAMRISLRELIGDPLQYQVYAYIVKRGETQVADRIGPLLVGGAPQEAHGPLFLAFWDSFPSATPAQALRRWSGAHTGPYGQRHGLSVLLQAASQSNIPVAVLDLKRSEQLSALESVGGMAFISQLQKDKLLLLPDLAYGDPQAAATSLQFSLIAGQRFRLSTSPFLYGAVDIPTPGGLETLGKHQGAFARLQDSSHLRVWNNIRLVPLPDRVSEEDLQVDMKGLPVAARAALLQAALSPDPADLVVLGGSLPNSPWGDSLIAVPAFRYIAGHPWIRTLDSEDLLHFPAAAGAPDCPDLLCLPAQETFHPRQAQIRQALQDSPGGLFRDLAWQTYLSLTQPTPDPRLQALRAGYLGQVGPILAAAHWNAAPGQQSACIEDINWDGAPECILSSYNIFLALDPMGGRLTFAAARIGNEPLEWIGPRSQFVVGLGDEFEWHPERGLAADPQEIPGAFGDPLDPGSPAVTWSMYQAETHPGVIILTNPQDGTRKIFRLTAQGVQVFIESRQPRQTQIPLALINGHSYEPSGFSRYHTVPGLQGFVWEMDRSASLQLSVNGARVSSQTFSDSRQLMDKPEDPNIGYPSGHFVPFPLAVIDLQPEGNYSVDLQLEKR